MLFITDIIIENFKSFHEKTIIKFNNAFTIVTGENGSGKSTIIDAVRFVLNAKHQDLDVNSASELLHKSSADAEGYSVQLIFIINQEKHAIERSFNVNEKQFYYYFNDKLISVEEYKVILKNFDLHSALKHRIVRQGNIFYLISQTPMDRTKYFEEISGSIEYKRDYNEAKEEYDSINNDYQQLYNKRKRLEQEKKAFTTASKFKHEFENLNTDLQHLNTQLILSDIFVKEKNTFSAIGKLKDLLNQDKELREKLKLDGSKSEHFETKLENLQIKLDTGQTLISDINNLLESNNQNLEQIQYKINCINKSRKAIQMRSKQAIEVYSKRKEEKESLENDLRFINENLASSDSPVDQDSREFVENELSEYYILNDVAEKQTKHNRDKLEHLTNKLEQLNWKRDALKCQVHNLKERILEDKKSLARISENKKLIDSDFEKIDVEEVSRLLEQCLQEEHNLLQECSNIQNKLDEKDDMKNETEHKAKAEYQLKLNFQNKVLGRLSNLCYPINEKYNIALAKVLSRWMNAIVVDTSETAIECIRFLKNLKYRYETFLPLDNLQPVVLKSQLQKCEVPLAYSLLQFNKNISKAVLFAVKNTLVCDDAETASNLSLYYKTDCVTLKGDLFSKSGLISGGLFDLEKKVQMWNYKFSPSQENFIDQLAEKQTRLEEVRENIKKYNMILNNAKEISENVQVAQSRLKYLNVEESRIKERLEKGLATMQQLNDELSDIECKIEPIKEEISKEKDAISRTKNEVFVDFCEKYNSTNIEEYEKKNFKYQKDKQQRLLDLEKQKNRIESLLEKYADEIKHLKENIEQWKVQDQDLENELKQCNKEMANIKKELNQLEQQKHDHQSVAKKIENEMKALKDIVEAQSVITNELSLIKQEKFQCKINIYNLIQQRYQILTNAHKDGIDLPLTTTSSNVFAEDIISVSSSLEEMLNKRFKVIIDYSILDEELQNPDNDARQKYYDELKEKRNKIEEELNQLEEKLTSTFQSDNRLATITKTLIHYKKEINKLQKRLNEAKTKFHRIAHKRKQVLIEMISYLDENLSRIYSKLVGDPSTSANVLCLNPENPFSGGILINCIIKSKFHSAESLSGGEQTMLAFALLLTINQKSPTFIMCDELDAPLDSVNVSFLISYFEKLKNSTQIIYITLNDTLISVADSIVGTFHRITDFGTSTCVLTYDSTI